MRISREQMFMGIARVVSQRSTCHRLNVGAVVVKEDRVLSTGYNGSSPLSPHCGGTQCEYFMEGRCRVIHAERNATWFAVGSLAGAHIYVTHSPCSACADIIFEAGITHVFYESEYRDPTPLIWLINRGLEVFRLTPSGYIITMGIDNEGKLVTRQVQGNGSGREPEVE